MYYKFLEYIERESLFNKEDRILLAVSGGRDSMVMIRLFETYGVDFGIAHFNHKTRNGDSDLDQEFIRGFALKKNIPFYTVDVDIAKKIKAGEGNNFQDLAHKIRYSWLHQVREKEGYQYIATAHHKDDNIETVLYKLAKGSGINGLLGIHSKNGVVIRPMLDITREEIDIFVREYDVSFVEDKSNLKDDYDRNFIRHNIVPQFVNLNPEFSKRMSITIENLKDVDKQFKFLLDYLSSKFIIKNGKYINIAKEILAVPYPESLLFHVLQKYGFNKSQAKDIFESIDHTGAIINSEKFKLLIDRDIFVLKEKEEVGFVEKVINIGQNIIEGYGELIIELVEARDIKSFDKSALYLDKFNIEFPLTIRNWKAGDRFKPFGLKGKTKKLKDYFTDKKLNRFEKEEVLLLVNKDEICIVVGHDISYDYRITPKSKKVVKIQFNKFISV